MPYKIGIENGYYGRWKIVKKGEETEEVFEPYGRAVNVYRILQPLDAVPYMLELSYIYGGTKHTYVASRGEISDPASCKKLADRGIDVTKRTFDAFSASISMQEEARLRDDDRVFYFESLGWLNTPVITKEQSRILCYRASKAITVNGVLNSLYHGDFSIKPLGTFEEWVAMVKEYVVAYVPLSIVLLCALSSVVAGMLAYAVSIGNGILHVCAVSCSGKSTAAYLAASVLGEPFDYVRDDFDANGNLIKRRSVLQSFAATDNALIGKLAGNWGIPIIIDELNKNTSDDLTNTVFSLYDGNGKSRYSKDLKVTEEAGFRGTILTFGETSLLDRCKRKLEGLYNRVFEMRDALTVSAEHSKIIKECAVKNNGRAAPKLAKYILDMGGVDYVCPIYDKWCKDLQKILPDAAFKDKFIAVFPALYLTTAEIAKDALGIEFLTDSIIEYFASYLQSGDAQMNVSAKSYAYLLNEFATHSNNFYHEKGSNEIASKGEIWGRYNAVNKWDAKDRRIVGEYLVRPNIVDGLLKKEHYSKPQCIETWMQQGLISCDKDRPTRSRKIDVDKQKSEDVFVFYAFAQEEDADE